MLNNDAYLIIAQGKFFRSPGAKRFAYLISGCKSESVTGIEVPLDSLEQFIEEHPLTVEKGTIDTSAFLKATIPTKREELGSIRTVVKIMDGSKNAGVAVPGFGSITLSRDESTFSVYYIETKVVDQKVYGIGYSVHYLSGN